MSKQLNELLKELRLNIPLLQEEVSDETGLTRSSISRYENGQTVPGVRAIRELTQVLTEGLSNLHRREVAKEIMETWNETRKQRKK